MRKYKPRIRMSILMFIFALSMLMLPSTLTVYADDEFTAGVKEAITTLGQTVNSTSSGSGHSFNSRKHGCSYARTGYLCYLIDKDGNSISEAYAFKSAGYNGIAGSIPIIKSKRGHSVGNWKEPAPWPYTPWTEEGIPNEPSIKEWFNSDAGDNKLNSQKFIVDNWGDSLVEKFENNEAYLVVETLMGCQFSIAQPATLSREENEAISNAARDKSYILLRKGIKGSGEWYSKVGDMQRHFGLAVDSNMTELAVRAALKNYLTDEGKKEALKLKEGDVEFVGDPIIGTPRNILEYRSKLSGVGGLFNTFLLEIAPNAEKLAISEAGFTAPGGDGKKSEGEVRDTNSGTAMMIIHYERDSVIKTYWQPNGSPGKPEPAKPNKTGTCAIVKGYYEENETTGVKTSLGVFSEKDTTNNIQICEEPGFELVRWDISTVYNDTLDPTDWTPPSSLRDGKNPETVKLETPEKVVYVLLKRTLEEEEEAPADVNYTLSQTTITRQIHISEPDNQLTMPKIEDHEFIWKLLGHVVECSGHRCDGHEVTKSGSHDSDCPSDCTSSHSYTDTEYHDNVYCSNWQWFDDKLIFSLKNEQKENFPDVLATKSGWENIVNLKGLALWVQPYTRTIPEETLKGYKNLDYACVLLRGKDKLTVAEWKNTDLGTSAANSDLKEVSSAGFCVGNTLMGSRKTEDYKDNFTVSIVDNLVDNTTKYGATKDGQAECGQTWSATHTHTIKGIEIEKFDIPVSVQLDVYSGSLDGGINDTTCATGRQNHKVSGYNKSNGIEVKYNGTIDFLPYVQMNYDTYTEKYRTAYVLGEHKRSITPNAYAEISWNETAGENLRLSSLQWSTHKSATDKWGAGNVLPGGAALTLSIPSSDRQKIVLTSYQVILEGSGKTQVENTGGSVGEFTREKAIELHQAYVDSVVKGYESLCVEQWVNTNTTNPAWNGGKAVHEQDDISFISSGLHASEDSKYYFRKDGEQGNGAGEGDLDVEDHGISLTDTYTFFTNTYGEVRYIKNNVNPNIGNEKMGELASGGMAEFLNKRTHIVDKLAAAVEHGTGQDKSYGIDGMRSKTSEHWYNESMDGVSILIQQSVITVGFKEPGERTNILDPRLCKPNTSGQSGMFKDGSYSSSQYKCKDHTEVYGIKDKVGTFMNVDVYTESMDMLYKSKIFYIPNVNTQDLH